MCFLYVHLCPCSLCIVVPSLSLYYIMSIQSRNGIEFMHNKSSDSVVLCQKSLLPQILAYKSTLCVYIDPPFQATDLRISVFCRLFCHLLTIGCTIVICARLCCHKIDETCKAAWLHLRNIGKIRKYQDKQSTEKLVHAFTSKIDVNNSLLYGLSDSLLQIVQQVQNSAACIVTRSQKHDHITSILCELHWFSAQQCILYKVLMIV